MIHSFSTLSSCIVCTHKDARQDQRPHTQDSSHGWKQHQRLNFTFRESNDPTGECEGRKNKVEDQ